MNKTLLKVFAIILMLTGGLVVLFNGSPAMQTGFARNIAAVHRLADSKDLPTGAKSKLKLNKDSASEYGDVAFDHDTHSFNKYSVDGKTDIGCAECHHTDQPKASLKPPLITAERDVVLTADALKKPGAAVVKSCLTCHFRENDIPDGKEMPVASYKDAKGKSETKELTNELAYHINCNTCHDAAAKLRPELKKKPGFATEKDCLICHTKN
jgi:hypothetical protein